MLKPCPATLHKISILYSPNFYTRFYHHIHMWMYHSSCSQLVPYMVLCTVCMYVCISPHFVSHFMITLFQIEVSELNFSTYSSLDLREIEENLMYPPRFKISVIRLSHHKCLDTKFKITLENNGGLISDEVRIFPLTVTELPKMHRLGKDIRS